MSRPVIGPHSGPKEALLTYAKSVGAKRIPEVQRFLDELYTQNIFDAFMIAIQSIHETDDWKSGYWENHLNAGGLGITYPGEPSRTWNNGTDSARAMLIHHAAYTGISLPEAWKAWLPLDLRYEDVRKAGMFGTVQSWENYGNGWWAVDPRYYAEILERESAVRTFAKTPAGGGKMPKIVDKWLHVAQDGYAAVNRRIIGRYGMQPKVIVLHIQEGYNWGSWQHFHVVSASSTVLIGANGDIWRLVPESDGPWTNGDVKSPTARGWSILTRYGADPNVYSLTIETEGFTGIWPKPQAQLDSVVWQIREWMRKYDIPLENVIKHGELNTIDRRFCPGDAFYNYVIGELKKAQQPAQPTYAKANVLRDSNGKPWDGKTDITVNNITFFGDIRRVTTSRETPVRVFATKSSAFTRSALASGTTVSVVGWTVGEAVDGEDRWWITKQFSRISASDTVDKPARVKPVEDEVKADMPPDVKFFRGKAYYPVGDDMEPLTVVVKGANLRQDATTQSRVLGKVSRGDTVKAAYWTFGDEIANESIWWVLEHPEGKEPLKHSPRLWVAATAGAAKDRPD